MKNPETLSRIKVRGNMMKFDIEGASKEALEKVVKNLGEAFPWIKENSTWERGEKIRWEETPSDNRRRRAVHYYHLCQDGLSWQHVTELADNISDAYIERSEKERDEVRAKIAKATE